MTEKKDSFGGKLLMWSHAFYGLCLHNKLLPVEIGMVEWPPKLLGRCLFYYSK